MTKVFFILLGFSLQTMAFAQTSPFEGGSGSASDPYQISTATQLNSVRNYLNSCFVLINDIDLGVAPYNTGDGWLPIGNYDSRFRGTFNGSGFVVRNLYINRATTSYIGLFGYIDEASIDSIGVVNCINTGNYYVGGLAGYSYSNSTITNSYALGRISGNYQVGGLAGVNYAGCSISNCYSSGSVSGIGSDDSEEIGGLVGHNENAAITNCHTSTNVLNGSRYTGGFVGVGYSNSSISNCYAMGDVTGLDECVGGFAGRNYYSTITNCFATGNVSSEGDYYTGGLVGKNEYYSTLTNCYATGNVTNTGQYTGGLVGLTSGYSTFDNNYATGNVSGGNFVGGLAGLSSNGALNNCYSAGSVTGGGSYIGGEVGEGSACNNFYYNSETSGQNDNDGRGVPVSTSGMKQQSTYNIWDFASTWHIRIDSTYPGLQVLDNAPFAFNDIINVGDSSALAAVLFNDYDIETKQTALIFDIISQDGTGTIVNNAGYKFPVGASPGYTETLKYRVGEVRISHGDTLWGNCANSLFIKVENTAPVITSAAPVSATEGMLYIYTVTATDAEGEIFIYTLNEEPAGMEINGNVITWTPATGTITSGEVSLTVSDGELSDTETFTINVIEFNSAPVITSAAPTTAVEGVQYTYTVVATDAEDDALTYSLSGEPSGMVATGNVITWTPAAGTTTSGNVTLTVSDGGLTDTETFTITVSTSGSTAVTNTRQANINVCPNPVNDKLNIQLRADDLPAIIRVYSFDGKQVLLQETNSSLTELEMENLHSGIYILKIATPVQTIEKKIIKQ